MAQRAGDHSAPAWRARRWPELWLLLATQEEEDLEVIKVILEERIPKHIVEQTIVE